MRTIGLAFPGLVITILLTVCAGCSEHEDVQLVSPQETVATGTMVGLGGHDAVGTVKLIKAGKNYIVNFEDDFRVDSGPDLYVYLGRDGGYAADTLISRLKSNTGSQRYAVPYSISITNYNEVWVWCRKFSVPFGKAVLE